MQIVLQERPTVQIQVQIVLMGVFLIRTELLGVGKETHIFNIVIVIFNIIVNLICFVEYTFVWIWNWMWIWMLL